MAKKKDPQINLLPKEEFDESTFGRVLKWLLTTFRYVVIVTEMVVMGAFLSRFFFDAKSGDLIDAINQKKAVISSYSTFESQFRATQNKLKIFANYSGDDKKISPLIDFVSSKLPSDITLTDVSIDKSKMTLTATTTNQNSVAGFINSLNSSSFFTHADLTSVETKAGTTGTTLTLLTITADIKQGGTNGG